MISRPVITVRGVIYNNGKIFGQKQLDGGIAKDYWCTPGGKLEARESLTEGLRREMIEETGVEPVIGRLLFVQQYESDDKEYIEFFYHIENASDYESIDLEATTHGTEEVSECGFIDPRMVDYRPADLQAVDLEKMIHSLEPVPLFDHLGDN